MHGTMDAKLTEVGIGELAVYKEYTPKYSQFKERIRKKQTSVNTFLHDWHYANYCTDDIIII